MTSIVPWVSFCFDFLLSVGLLVVAVTVVRATHATSGYLLAGAAALDLLASCCFRGEEYAMQMWGMSVVTVISLLGIAEKVLFYGLVIGAAFTLANAVLAKRGPV